MNTRRVRSGKLIVPEQLSMATLAALGHENSMKAKSLPSGLLTGRQGRGRGREVVLVSVLEEVITGLGYVRKIIRNHEDNFLFHN